MSQNLESSNIYYEHPAMHPVVIQSRDVQTNVNAGTEDDSN